MKYVLKVNETIGVNEVIKRGSFPANLRIKRIYNSNNLQAQFLQELLCKKLWELMMF